MASATAIQNLSNIISPTQSVSESNTQLDNENIVKTGETKMGEFASNAKANAGLTTGIIGTSLAGLLALNNSSQGGGLLSGILGTNNNLTGSLQQSGLSTLIAENALLKAENYSDKVAKESATVTLDRLDKMGHDYIRPIADEVAANKVVVAKLQSDIEHLRDQHNHDIHCLHDKYHDEFDHLKETQRLREQIVEDKITNVAQTSACGIASCNAAIQNLANTVAGITKCVVPATAICPQPMPQFNSWTAPTASTAG